MISFKNQIKQAENENKNCISSLLKQQKTPRVTQLVRIEISRFRRLKVIAQENRMTISKLLDEVIDIFN